MYFWSAFPFVRITIAFSLGIASAVFAPGYQIPMYIVLGICLVFLLLYKKINRAIFLTFNAVFGFIIVLTSFVLGYLHLSKVQHSNQYFTFSENTNAYIGIIITQPEKKGAFYRATLQATRYRSNSNWHKAHTKVNMYVRSDTLPFRYGNEVLVKGSPTTIAKPMNPGEFNYKRYLSFLGVYYQQFIDPTQIALLGENKGNYWIAASLQQRERFSKLLEKFISKPEEVAIAKALLLGNKSGLDTTIKETYAASGAMHVLAVSGLHVGIIYVVILVLLKLVPEPYRKPWLVTALSIPLLWGYAFITGLSPSVLRAVTLFSIIAIGQALNRRASMVNLLAVSAIILLVYNPYLLMQVGFQLSYVAVLGILFLYPQIRLWWLPSHRATIFFWDVTAISIAAQISTFPLSMLYFHRFPPYFLVSNVVVIPVATIIVWLGVAFFASSYVWTTLSALLGKAIEYLIFGINWVLKSIEQLPGSNIDGLYLDIPQTWILYVIILCVYLFVVYKHKFWVIAGSASMIIFSILIGVRIVKNNTTPLITVYKVPNHYAIDLIQAGHRTTFIDAALKQQSEKIKFHIRPNRLITGSGNSDRTGLAYKAASFGDIIVWNGTSIFIQSNQLMCHPQFDVIINKNSTDSLWLPTKHMVVSLAQQGAWQETIDLPHGH